MKSTSHFAIGHFLYAAMQSRGINLNRVAFVYGNIAPDYDPNLLFPTHFSKTCERRISEIAAELSELPLEKHGRVGAEYSKQLGILCHFICDYFCRAHNKDFEGGLKHHAFYENRLDFYLRKSCLRIFDIHDDTMPVLSPSAARLTDDIAKIKSEYLSVPHTLETDLDYAFRVCLQAICSLVLMSQQLDAVHVELWLEDLIAQLKGYATGNSLVFRMFFYKNRHSNIFFLPDLMPPIYAG